MIRSIACFVKVVIACATVMIACRAVPTVAGPNDIPLTVTLTLTGATVDDSYQVGNGDSALTLAEKEAIGARLFSCWKLPALALKNLDTQYAELLVRVKRDGSQDGAPLVKQLSTRDDKIGMAFRESAVRSWKECLPLKGPSNKYYRWRSILIRFDPLGKKPEPAPLPPPQPPTQPASAYLLSPTYRQLTEPVTGALDDLLSGCWNQKDDNGMLMRLPQVVLMVSLKRDGNVAKDPIVLEMKDRSSPLSDLAIKRAKQAIYTCAPYDFLPSKLYEHWNTITVQF